MGKWKRGPDSNRHQADYESAVLPLNYPAVRSCRRRIRFLRPAFGLELAEANGGTGYKIGLFLGQTFVPLRNPAACKAYCAGQICGGFEKINGFGFGHAAMFSALNQKCQSR